MSEDLAVVTAKTFMVRLVISTFLFLIRRLHNFCLLATGS